MSYNDGHGKATLPNTGKVHHFTNRQAVMGRDHIGLNDSMDETAKLGQIFELGRQGWETHLPELQQDAMNYRNNLIQKAQEANKVLGDGFWYYIYNNDGLSREALHRYLNTQESNPTLRELPVNSSAGIHFLYTRMKFIRLHPAIKLWYIFWDDFYYNNRKMNVIQPYEDDFDPMQHNSICYKVTKRSDLEAWLEERRLLGSTSKLNVVLGVKQYFNEDILDTLYQQISSLQNPHLVEVKI